MCGVCVCVCVCVCVMQDAVVSYTCALRDPAQIVEPLFPATLKSHNNPLSSLESCRIG